MNNLKFKDKKVAVLGMGIEGLALVDFLVDKGCKISVLDKLPENELLLRLLPEEKNKLSQIIKNGDIVKVFGDNYLDGLKQFDIIFRSPGISYLNQKIQEAERAGVIISSQIKLFFDLCPCKIIGVTGTKGKGTTASLIYEIMKRNNQETRNNNQTESNIQNSNGYQLTTNNYQPSVYLAGNIGYPAISLLSQLKSDDVVILELSSFQLMDLEKSPHIAVITNLYVDHLDYHKDTDEYRNAKKSILKFQNGGDWAVLNSDSTFDPAFIDSEIKSKIKYFSHTKGADAVVKDGKVILDPENRSITICDEKGIKLFGQHNLENIAAATLVADILKIDIEIVREAVKDFTGLPHRLEFVTEIDGVKFINDSFATNPEPTKAAIDSFSQDKILILGGSSKGADFSDLAQKIVSSNVKGVVLIGDEADKIEQTLITSSYKGPIKKGFLDMDSIVKGAQELSSLGDVIILSPACASFGLFSNYKDRGEKFKASVIELQNHES